MIKVNLLHDHGSDPGQGDRFIIGRMLENAYALGFESGVRTQIRAPLGSQIKVQRSTLARFITRLRNRRA